jgi:hypothetical protein
VFGVCSVVSSNLRFDGFCFRSRSSSLYLYLLIKAGFSAFHCFCANQPMESCVPECISHALILGSLVPSRVFLGMFTMSCFSAATFGGVLLFLFLSFNLFFVHFVLDFGSRT